MKKVDLTSLKCVVQSQKSFTNNITNSFYFFPNGNTSYIVQTKTIDSQTKYAFYSCADYGMGTCTEIGTPFSQLNSQNLENNGYYNALFRTYKTVTGTQKYAICIITNDSGDWVLNCRICPSDMSGCSSGTGYFPVSVIKSHVFNSITIGFKNENVIYAVYSKFSGFAL